MIHSVAYGSASKRANQKITEISDLIYESYSRYGQLTSATIERLRFKHRIKVVQNLEENSVKNMIRSLQSNPFVNHYLDEGELQEFYGLVKEELLRQQYWGRSTSIVQENVSQPIYENVKLDFDLFKTYFLQMSTWAEGENVQKLALRLFRFMDDNDDGYLNLLEFLILMILLLKADTESRLKLFFYIHTVILPEENVFELDEEDEEVDDEQLIASALTATESKPCRPLTDPDTSNALVEIATEATEYIDCISELEISSNTSTSSAEMIENVYPRVTVYQILPPELSLPASPKHSPMHFYHHQITTAQVKRDQDQLADLADRKPGLPPLKKEQFIQLWKSLYDMFSRGCDREPALVNAVASFGTGLLKMGELAVHVPVNITAVNNAASEAVRRPMGPNIDSMSTDSFELVSKAETTSFRQFGRESLWAITFEQFKATLFVEECLAQFFERTSDMKKLFQKYRDNRRFDRASSLCTKD